MYDSVPVVYNKHNHLYEGNEQLRKVRDSLISVIHSWKVNHIKTFHIGIQVVKEGYSRALYCCCTYRNLKYVCQLTEREFLPTVKLNNSHTIGSSAALE